MKSIIYILLAVFIASIVVTALPKSSANHFQVISIESVEKNPDSIQMYQSASIIKSRLSDYGLENFEIRINKEKHKIEILLKKEVNVKEILPLILSKGKVEFNETFKRGDVIKLLEPGDSLFQLLEISEDSSAFLYSSPVLGYCKVQNLNRVANCITSHYISMPADGIKFAWGYFPESEGNYALYLLKHQSALNKEHLQKASIMEKSNEKNPELMLVFNENAVAAWRNVTKNNIGKSIALLIDENVVYAPTVKSEINEGKCLISGNFSKSELSAIQTIINNEILPLEFRLIE